MLHQTELYGPGVAVITGLWATVTRRGEQEAGEGVISGISVMVAAGGYHSIEVMAEDNVWTFGCGGDCQLGHVSEEDILVLTKIRCELFAGSLVVMVEAG